MKLSAQFFGIKQIFEHCRKDIKGEFEVISFILIIVAHDEGYFVGEWEYLVKVHWDAL